MPVKNAIKTLCKVTLRDQNGTPEETLMIIYDPAITEQSVFDYNIWCGPYTQHSVDNLSDRGTLA